MKRNIENQLVEWQNSKNRKPLILRGARQVGKSWSVELFGGEHCKRKVHIVNLEKRPDWHVIFDLNFDVKRILLELELQLNDTIDPNKDPVFIDEIQTCPKALMSLRYFYEDIPELRIIAAGSLLDFVLKEISYPVGRVEHMDMHPMTFQEFLIAIGQIKLAEILDRQLQVISEKIDETFKYYLNQYFVIGGMTACVKTFIETNSLISVAKIQNELLSSFRENFKKYPVINVDCLNDVLLAVTSNIGGQIKYARLSDRFSGPTIKKGFDLLKTARIFHQVQNVSLAGLPLMPAGIQFKSIFLDIGLLIRIQNLNIAEDFSKSLLIASFQGALAEQFIGQELMACQNTGLNYWSNIDKGTISEIDFVIEEKNEIIPIEVKAGKQGSLKSLHLLLNKYAHIKRGIVFSGARFCEEGKIHFLPLYLAGIYFKKQL